MNIDKIIKKGLSGDQIGRLFIEDFIEFEVRLRENAKECNEGKRTLKESLGVKGLFTRAEKQKLTDAVKGEDIKIYNGYMSILEYIEDISVKMAYNKEATINNCYKIAYLIVTHNPEEVEAVFNNKGGNIDAVIESIKQLFYFYRVFKTTLSIIEEITGIAGIAESLEYDVESVEMPSFFINKELEKINEANYNKGIYKSYSLDLREVKIPQEKIEKAIEKARDVTFFTFGDYPLHYILGGLNE